MNWAHYLLQANIYLVVFYGFYRLLLDKETYFTLNRIYLVSAGIFSLTLPFIKLEWLSTQPVAQPVYAGVDQLNQLLTQVNVTPESTGKLNAGSLLAILYLVGVLFFLFKLLYQLIAVSVLLKNTAPGAAFSFLTKKSVDPALPKLQVIEHHEEIHIRQLHSLDVLFFEVLGILTWFNPIIYIYKHTLKNIHEYLADEAAAKFQGNKEEYALLLVSTAFGVPLSSLTNSFFNQSLLKKRIFMLHQQKSTKTALLKYGLFLPLFGLTLVLSSATIRNNETIKEVTAEIPLEKPLTLVTEAVGMNAGWEDFYQYVKKSLRYPNAAQELSLQGNSGIKFTLKNGEVAGLAIAAKALGSGCDAEVMKAILAYKNFKSIPDGNYLLTVAFRLSDQKTPVLNTDNISLDGYTILSTINVIGYGKSATSQTANSDPKVYDFVSLNSPPSFPGGMDRFYYYLRRSMKYPAEAVANKVEGKVFLSFVVEKDGRINEVRVERKLGSGTDEEAVRLLEASPRWVPGIQGGKAVRVKYNIPISFTLTPKTPKSVMVIHPDKGQTLSINAENGSKINISSPNKQPIIFIDGIRTKTGSMKDIDPNTIESMHVLKGEAAIASYGEDGKDGAILIKTKAKSINKFLHPKVETKAQP